MTERKTTITERKIRSAIEAIPEIKEHEDYVSPLRFPETEYPPVGIPEKLSVDDPAFIDMIDKEMDAFLGMIPVPPDATPDMVAIAQEVFKDMMAEPTKPERDMRPGKDKMMSLAGGMYLPVRRRVAWMRGEPSPKPLWSIVNTLLKYEMGTLEAPRGGGPGGKMPKISGGFAVVKSEVLDELGRIISTGYAQERSEVFPDFIEKAETAAVGRAMALAGFGTEAALDLDEGLDEENVVDSPVRPIVIGEGIGTDVKVGGRVANITNAQLKEIGRLVKDGGFDPLTVSDFITLVSGQVIPAEVLESDESANGYMVDILRKFTNVEATKMISALSADRDD